MSAQHWNEQELYPGFFNEFEWSAYDIDGNPVAFEPADVAHFNLAASEGGLALVQLDSDTVEADGSTVEIATLGSPGVPASGTVVLGAEATEDLQARRHYGELYLEDSGETPAGALKMIIRGTFKVRASITGP